MHHRNELVYVVIVLIKFYVLGVYIFNSSKEKQAIGKSWALPEVLVEQRQRPNTKTLLEANTQTVVNMEVQCNASTVPRERSKHSSQDLESIGKVEKSWQHSVAI